MKIVPERLRASGRNVVAHNDRFPPGTDDITWLTALAGTGYILLTKDGRIRRRPLERLALRGPDMAEALVRALPKIERLVSAAKEPIWGSVHADGRVTIIDSNA